HDHALWHRDGHRHVARCHAGHVHRARRLFCVRRRIGGGRGHGHARRHRRHGRVVLLGAAGGRDRGDQQRRGRPHATSQSVTPWKNAVCAWKLWRKVLGELPCNTDGPRWIATVESCSAAITRRNLSIATAPTVEVPFVTAPSRCQWVRSEETAQAT